MSLPDGAEYWWDVKGWNRRMVIIKFKKSVGDIPEGALGILRIGIKGNIDYSRVFILREYVGLPINILPCYDMPTDSSYWDEITEINLTKIELNFIMELNSEI